MIISLFNHAFLVWLTIIQAKCGWGYKLQTHLPTSLAPRAGSVVVAAAVCVVAGVVVVGGAMQRSVHGQS